MAKYRFYKFTPTFPEKYTGETIPIILRSSWEEEFAKHCDLSPTVIKWGYELVQIPYRDPLTGKQKVYIPDFFVHLLQADKSVKQFVFEVKPIHEQYKSNARNQGDEMLVMRNQAKWAAAAAWCDRHSAEFVILNENNLFNWEHTMKPQTYTKKGISKTYSPTKKSKAAGAARLKKMTSGVRMMQKKMNRIRSKTKSSTVARVGRVKRA